MGEIAVEGRQILPIRFEIEQVLAHAHKTRGAAGCPVETAKQLLSTGLGGEMQIRARAPAGVRAPLLHRLRQTLGIRPETFGQGLEECEPGGGVKPGVAIQRLARQSHARGLAPTRQNSLAKADDLSRAARGIDVDLLAAEQGAPLLGNARQKVGEEGRVHGLTQSRKPILRD